MVAFAFVTSRGEGLSFPCVGLLPMCCFSQRWRVLSTAAQTVGQISWGPVQDQLPEALVSPAAARVVGKGTRPHLFRRTTYNRGLAGFPPLFQLLWGLGLVGNRKGIMRRSEAGKSHGGVHATDTRDTSTQRCRRRGRRGVRRLSWRNGCLTL